MDQEMCQAKISFRLQRDLKSADTPDALPAAATAVSDIPASNASADECVAKADVPALSAHKEDHEPHGTKVHEELAVSTNDESHGAKADEAKHRRSNDPRAATHPAPKTAAEMSTTDDKCEEAATQHQVTVRASDHRASLQMKRVHELRSLCGELAIETNGTKAELIERIMAARTASPAEPLASGAPPGEMSTHVLFALAANKLAEDKLAEVLPKIQAQLGRDVV